jgi:hypothetical protein
MITLENEEIQNILYFQILKDYFLPKLFVPLVGK